MTRLRGFTITELMIAMVIAGIIGVALTRLVINQARFVGTQDGMMRARGGARAALNMLTSELRMVADSGLVQASRDSVTLRVPYAFGVACSQVSGATQVSLLPADSAAFASAVISGYAWRDSTGKYNFVQPATIGAGSTSYCVSLSPAVTTLSAPGWPATVVAVTPNVVATQPGSAVYLYQLVRYAFAPSAQLAGRIGMWRSVAGTGIREELVTPFDSSARFEFLVGQPLTVQETPPPNLDDVRGLRVHLVASSEAPPEGRSTNVVFDLTTNLLFRNHVQ
jgi:prepilin-type N-terminal cleavage/methylation domain-containing protein